MRLSQHEIIIKAMLEHPEKENWKATDFQSGEYFVGYEATARMSEIIYLYHGLVNIGKDGRFRTLSINWKNKKLIKQIKKLLGIK
jgi:hypothetical protein